MSHIQWQTRGRGFDVGSRSGFVGGFEAGADEHEAETAAVVGGVDGEDVEDWDLWLVWGGDKGWGCCVLRILVGSINS